MDLEMIFWLWRSDVGCCLYSDFVSVVLALRWFLVLAVVLVEWVVLRYQFWLWLATPATIFVVVVSSLWCFNCCCVSLSHEAVYWIMMGRSSLLRDRELVSSGNFMGWFGVSYGGLEVFVIGAYFRCSPTYDTSSYFFTGLCSYCTET
jgi:hypothetical protein